MDRLLWLLLVISCALVASLLGGLLRWALIDRHKKPVKLRRRRGRDDDEDEDEVEEDDDQSSSRNKKAQKGLSPVALWIFAGVGGGILVMLFMCGIIGLIAKAISDSNEVVAKDGDPPKDGKPVEPVAEDLGPKEKQTQILGAANNQTFRDEAPAGGRLIGFELGLSEAFNVDMVRAVQPIYGTPNGEVAGRRFGADFTKPVLVKAKPGYAVGALNVKAGLIINGFSVTFMRVKGDGLDPTDSYSTQWIGDKTGGNGPILLAGDGATIVGVIGRHNARECTGIGLLRKK
ncbi:MAG: hypothetical protein EXR98_05885 [Gemmataceae bacterium]|nr:hypothetical protein [Gemmataceae bacterium]